MVNFKKNPSGKSFFNSLWKKHVEKITRIFLSKYVFFYKMNMAYFWKSYHHADKFILYKFILLFFEFDAKWNNGCDICYTTVNLVKTSVLTSKTTSFQRYDWTLNVILTADNDVIIRTLQVWIFVTRHAKIGLIRTWYWTSRSVCASSQCDLRVTMSTDKSVRPYFTE